MATVDELQLSSEIAREGDKVQFVFRLPAAEVKVTYSDADQVIGLIRNLPHLMFDVVMGAMNGDAEEVELGEVEYSTDNPDAATD